MNEADTLDRQTMTQRLVNHEIGFFERDLFVRLMKEGFRGFDNMSEAELLAACVERGIDSRRDGAVLDSQPALREFTERGLPWPGED
jgi:hypothetical protein